MASLSCSYIKSILYLSKDFSMEIFLYSVHLTIERDHGFIRFWKVLELIYLHRFEILLGYIGINRKFGEKIGQWKDFKRSI
jgi:hypothetical protein